MNYYQNKIKQIKIEAFWTGFLICGVIETLYLILIGVVRLT